MKFENSVTLHNGLKMPVVGLGVFLISKDNVSHIVKTAIHNGYRSIDTAQMYENEKGVGIGIKESGLDRSQLFITSKVWNNNSYDKTFSAVNQSLENMGLEYIDLYLVHWPGKNDFKNTWRALEEMYLEGKIKSIGVSNFHIHHLENLMSSANIKPMINQVEFHPFLNQKELLNYCKKKSIQLEAWSPLMQGYLMNNNILIEIARKYDKTVAQVILRWHLQHGIVTIPKTVNEERLIENIKIFNFKLSADDMLKIDNLNIGKRLGPNPDLSWV
ncbi:aldo/keto reductase [Bacillus toyonensis]|uniref:aldo/keto reductase n=1 Tax=Bacillus toyonensis TaxID=155322 RepID=UPI0015D479D5|nr:aldo/keto reductase [Bacillus toyonensis]